MKPDAAISKALHLLAQKYDLDSLTILFIFGAADRFDELIAQNTTLRNAVASVLCAGEPGCPTLADARKACVEALKEVAE